LHINDIHLFTIVSNNITVQTVSNINYNTDSVYSRQAIKYNVNRVIFSTIVDSGNILTETVKRVVVLLRNIKLGFDIDTQQSNNSQLLQYYKCLSRNISSSRLLYKEKSKLIEID